MVPKNKNDFGHYQELPATNVQICWSENYKSVKNCYGTDEHNQGRNVDASSLIVPNLIQILILGIDWIKQVESELIFTMNNIKMKINNKYVEMNFKVINTEGYNSMSQYN